MANISQAGKPILLQEQGSFAIGGTVATAPGEYDPHPMFSPPAGQTCHGDHAYVQYQIPPNAKSHPLVMLHGGTTFGKTWESTFDGREGYQSIFLRKGYAVYIVDRPRQARASRGTEGGQVAPSFGEQSTFAIWRLGVWPDYFKNVQVPRDPEYLSQLFRSMVPSVGPRIHKLTADALSQLFGRIGPAVLVTHSLGGIQGWLTAIASENIAGIISYEPTQFIFPEGEVPDDIKSNDKSVNEKTRNLPVPQADFAKLTRYPIQIVYGDNIPATPSAYGGLDLWRVSVPKARQFADTLNRHGGKAEILELPKIGVFGNSHFPFSDLNNLDIAELMCRWLESNGLSG
jgi:pimeloyl-ACP methyl ester carboxylesterase